MICNIREESVKSRTRDEFGEMVNSCLFLRAAVILGGLVSDQINEDQALVTLMDTHDGNSGWDYR